MANITLDTVNYLVDLLTAKNHLGIGSADTKSDSSVILLINAVSQWFKKKTERQLRQSAIIEYRDGDGGYEMRVYSPPVESLVLNIDTGYDFGSSTIIPSASLILDETGGLVTLKADVFTEGRKSIKLSYSGGYADPLTDAPDLGVAALFMIKKLWNPKDGLVSSVSIVGGNVAYLDSEAPRWVLDVLRRYKLEL